jgi:hypothetical protein
MPPPGKRLLFFSETTGPAEVFRDFARPGAFYLHPTSTNVAFLQ